MGSWAQVLWLGYLGWSGDGKSWYAGYWQLGLSIKLGRFLSESISDSQILWLTRWNIWLEKMDHLFEEDESSGWRRWVLCSKQVNHLSEENEPYVCRGWIAWMKFFRINKASGCRTHDCGVFRDDVISSCSTTFSPCWIRFSRQKQTHWKRVARDGDQVQVLRRNCDIYTFRSHASWCFEVLA